MIETTYIRKAKSWSEFSSSLNSLIEKNKKLQAGKIYEKCVQLFLQTDPKYQAALKNVWLLQDVPKTVRDKLKLPNADEGIDLIAETNQKEYWAIQAKYKSDKSSTLTRKDLATFRDLAFNYCKNIQHGLVCSPISHEPKKSNLMNKMGFALINEWEDLDKDKNKGWKNIQKKLGGKAVKPEKFKPKPHQSKAIKEVIKAFKSKSVERGKMIMPCGTGKSLTAFWITRDMKVKNVLVAVPSLSLLQQTLNVWTKEFLANDIQPDYLCVCSDESAGSLEKDEFTAQTYDLGIRTTTEINEICSFLKNKNSKFKIIFTTYQSGQVTAKASKKAKFTYDLGIMDEAHKTVGHKLKPMAHLLYEKNIKIKKRLFMTATERFYRGNSDEILSMNNFQDYGENLHYLTFKEAINYKPKIISDYKIITFNITNKEIDQLLNDNKYIALRKTLEGFTARDLATAIGLRKAIRKLKIRNVISFHSSISNAKNFQNIQNALSKYFKKFGEFKTFHVSGDMQTSKRLNQMNEFAENDGLMTNARCLTEGVDLPAIDCVVFNDPKKSKVDIVQAAGRAMRLSKGKKFGYILIPIIINNDDDIKEITENSIFEDVITTIKALSSQDGRILDYLSQISLGKRIKKTSPIDGITKLNLYEKIDETKFEKSIQLKIWDRIAFGNWKSYEEAKKIVHKLNIRTIRQWSEYVRDKKKRPKDIPMKPSLTYPKEVWKGWGDFLGTGNLSPHNRTFMKYADVKKFAQQNKIKDKHEWKKLTMSKNFRDDVPKDPYGHFKKKGLWVSWEKFLGVKQDKFLSYKETKALFRKNKIQNSVHWFKFKAENNIKNIPTSLPLFYKNKGWISWPSICGKYYKGNEKEYRSFKSIKLFLIKNGITSSVEWSRWCKKNKKPEDIPMNIPKQFSKEVGSWSDVFETAIWDYDQAKEYIRKLKFKTAIECKKYLINKKIINIPKNPQVSYKNKKQWISWEDFLGNSFNSKKSLEYIEAKKIIKKFKLKKPKDYFDLSNKIKEKFNLPIWPKSTYYRRGQWKGWDDFLGKN